MAACDDAGEQSIYAASIDGVLPDALLAGIVSHLDARSLVAASASSRAFRAAAAAALTFIPAFHLLEVALDLELLRRLMPTNPHLRGLRLDCGRLEDSAIPWLARPTLHDVFLLNCDNLSGKLLRQLGAKCSEVRTISLSSLAERRGLLMSFADLEELLTGCIQLESLSLAVDFSKFDDPKFSDVWLSASRRLSSLEIGYIPMEMLFKLLAANAELNNALSGRIKANQSFPSLQKLCLTVDCITDHLIALISTALPHLTHLDLQDTPITEPIASMDLTNDGLQLINQNSKLKHISLIRSQEFILTCFRRVNDLGILLMAEKCAKLESISLGGFSRVTDTGFRAIIHSCPVLQKLRVSHGSQLTDLVFHDIVATSLCLTHVSLRWCNLLTNVGVERLSFNKDLSVLDLRDCCSLGDEALRALSQLPKLRVLRLDGTDISNRGLSHLGNGQCPLASLSLRGCRRLTNDCIGLLLSGAVQSSLRVLDLSRLQNISDEGVALLARSRAPISELRMRECPKVGDPSIMTLASMHYDGGADGNGLRVLDLYDCGGITPLSVRWFKKPYFPRLRWLGVTGSSNRMMVDALARSRPFLHVACRGEELGTGHRDASSDLYGDGHDRINELDQWMLDGEVAPDDESVEGAAYYDDMEE